MRLAVIIGCLALVLVSWMTLLDEACFAARSLVYFSSPSCSDCLRVRDLLRDVESRYPDITVMEISIANENGQMLLEEYCRYCEVNEDEYGLVPTVIVGNKALVGFRTVSTFIEQAIEEVQADTPLPESFTGIAGAGAIDERFASFSAGALLAAGCVDGINPCAISTLLFFVSYMASTGQRGRMILGVGARFTLGVFISYTMMGWGLFRLLAVVEALTTAARFLYPAMAVLVTGLAFVSVFDYRRVRGAGTSRPLLALPIGLVRLIRPTIRRLTSYRLLLPMSFAVGFAVSLMEFLCTGQVYLPTLVFISGISAMRSRALAYLLLYNVGFIAPMVLVFVCACKASSSKLVERYFTAKRRGVQLVRTGLLGLLSVCMWVLSVRLGLSDG